MTALDAGTFAVVKARLDVQAEALGAAVAQLDAQRRALFGGATTELLATHRVRTEHNCIPRDIVHVGGRFLLGYQVFLGLQQKMSVDEVFAELAFTSEGIGPAEGQGLLSGGSSAEGFAKDFREIFQYHREARLLHLRRSDRQLLAVFQMGQRISDVKVLRWGITRAAGAEQERLTYVDNRGDRDYVFPAAHDFAWTRATRDLHVHGAHPHINIADTIFVECIHGDFTIKIENNTDSGKGIFSESVDDATQGLDDAEIHYAVLDFGIVLKVRPYRERAFRYVVYNRHTRSAVRIDAIGDACQQLPEGHGLVFPGGVCLADGSHKVFPVDATGMEFKRTRRSPNGEDVLYIFYRRDLGTYLLLTYNLINREVTQTQHNHSYTLLPDGRMIALRAEAEPGRVHTLQVWRTPFSSEEHAAAAAPVLAAGGGLLGRLGNRDVVRAVSDLLHVRRLLAGARPERARFEELLLHIARCLDLYPWLGDGEAFALKQRLHEARTAVEQAVDEYEKLAALAETARSRVAAQEAAARELLRGIRLSAKNSLEAFVQPLAQIRSQRGQVASLRELREVELPRIEALDGELTAAGTQLAGEAMTFLQRPEALAAVASDAAELEQSAAAIASVAAAAPLTARLDALAAGLDQVVETVQGLPIDDATQRTVILEAVGGVYSAVNRARAIVSNRRTQLATSEGRAGFAVQSQLLAQALASALALCDSPERCDEQSARLLIQVEELEGRFGEADEFLADLAAKRAEIAEAFAARRQQLSDDRARRADALQRAGERLLATIARRLGEATSLDALNSYLAADAMVLKLRAITADLRAIGASVKADDLDGRLRTARDDGLRRQRDRGELYDGEAVRLGRHRFSVNPLAPELSLLLRPGATPEAPERLVVAIAGTDYEAPLLGQAASDAETHRVRWAQTLVSEDSETARAETVAYLLLARAERGEAGGLDALREACRDDARLLDLVRTYLADRYDLGCERGIHDADAVRILAALVHLIDAAGLLRYAPAVRALAALACARTSDPAKRDRLLREAQSLHDLVRRLGSTAAAPARAALIAELAAFVAAEAGFALAQVAKPAGVESTAGVETTSAGSSPAEQAQAAGEYLFHEAARQPERSFVRSGACAALHQLLRGVLRDQARDLSADLAQELAALADDPAAQWRLSLAWCRGAAGTAGEQADALLHAVPELAAELLTPELPRDTHSVAVQVVVDGLLSTHGRITEGRLVLRLDAFLARLARFTDISMPAFRAWMAKRRDLIEQETARLRLAELRPRVLASFVRNRLIDELLLPLVGDNLAKQIGALGEGRRTDSQGLLLLLSPPGYGKTTLMEYIAATLGLAYVKISGPALGSRTRSLDPAEAPNVAARQEVERLTTALAMGNNVCLLIDDIQHCDPEFLQQFIGLCDGTRRCEGVFLGAPRTFDLRGKRFCIVMAGNPYTESGERFRLPDMLANRADTHNLGDLTRSSSGGDLFARSYLENCLVAQPLLQPLTSRPRADLDRFLRLTDGDDTARGELEHPYSAAEVVDIVAVLRLLRLVQGRLLTVNRAYIASAATAAGDRVEPPFLLQGSYRNMAKIAARVVPAMTVPECEALILDHYRAEAQTLSGNAEANLLKLRHLFEIATAAERARFADICRGYVRRVETGSASDDPAAQQVIMLAKLGDQVARLREAASEIADRGAAAQDAAQRGLTQAVIAGFARAEAAIGSALTALAKRPEPVLAPPPVLPPPAAPPKVEVINTLPKYYARLYEQHLHIIEHTLAPMIELLTTYVGTTQKTRQKIELVAADLRGMIQRTTTSERLDLKNDPGES